MTSTDLRKRTLEIAENIQEKLTWKETNVELPTHMPQKTPKDLKIEFELMDFSSEAVAILTVGVGKNLEKWMDFYKRMITTHNRCQTSAQKGSRNFLTERNI